MERETGCANWRPRAEDTSRAAGTPAHAWCRHPSVTTTPPTFKPNKASWRETRLLLAGLRVLLVGREVHLGLAGVGVEVKRGAIRHPDTLDPAVRALDLGVPAVLGVMRHLLLEVLAEAQARLVHAELEQEEVGARDEVAERLVGDDALLHGVADAHHQRLAVLAHLARLAEEVQL